MSDSRQLLSERDICTKFITSALLQAGWDINTQVLEEVSFTDGKIIVKGNLTTRGQRKRADYVLYYNANPVAIIEAKDNKHSIHAGLQQALEYARILDIPSSPQIRTPQSSMPFTYRQKVYVNGIDVSVLQAQELHFDINGKLIIKSLKDYTKEIINTQYASLDDFLSQWNEADRKAAIIKELEEQGVLVEALQNAVNKEVDLFDLICHVAYDQSPLSRKERANNVKKRNYFTRYGEQAKQVLEALLEKYADEGVITIESTAVLSLHPFDDFGTPSEIIKVFGNKEKYMSAIKELEKELYQFA